MITFLLGCKQFMIGNFLNFKFEFSKNPLNDHKEIVLTTISDKIFGKLFYFFKVNHIKFIFHSKSKRNLTTQKIFYWFPFVLMHLLLWMLKNNKHKNYFHRDFCRLFHTIEKYILWIWYIAFCQILNNRIT